MKYFKNVSVMLVGEWIRQYHVFHTQHALCWRWRAVCCFGDVDKSLTDTSQNSNYSQLSVYASYWPVSCGVRHQHTETLSTLFVLSRQLVYIFSVLIWIYFSVGEWVGILILYGSPHQMVIQCETQKWSLFMRLWVLTVTEWLLWSMYKLSCSSKRVYDACTGDTSSKAVAFV
jgi:hypothetical protein